MATSSLPPSPAFTCSVCQMFSYSSASFSDNGTCNKCSLYVVSEARLSELEARLCTVENHPIASQAPFASTEPPSIASCISRPELPVSQSGWVTVRKRSQSPKVKPVVQHQPVHVSNTVNSGLMSAPEHKSHPLILKRKSILYFDKPHRIINRGCPHCNMRYLHRKMSHVRIFKLSINRLFNLNTYW